MRLERDLVVLDLETTGRWVEKDRIVEVGMVKLSPNGEKTDMVRRVNPRMHIPEDVTRITGISDEDVKDEPEFKERASEVLEFIGAADIGGFNVERFDLPILQRQLAEAGHTFEWRNRHIYDAQKVYHLNEKRDLRAAYKFYCDKDLVGAHTALGDVNATLQILGAQLSKYVSDKDEIEALLAFDYEKGAGYFGPDKKFRWWNGELYPVFGKYGRRHSVAEIAKKEPSYLSWILTQDFSKEVKEMIESALKRPKNA